MVPATIMAAPGLSLGHPARIHRRGVRGGPRSSPAGGPARARPLIGCGRSGWRGEGLLCWAEAGTNHEGTATAGARSGRVRKLDASSEDCEAVLQAVTELTSACFSDPFLDGPEPFRKIKAWMYRWKTIEALKGFVKEPKRFFVLFIEDLARAAGDGQGAQSMIFEGTSVTEEGVTERGVVASCDVTLLQPGMQIQQGLNLWKEEYSRYPMAYVSSMAVAQSLRRQGVATELLQAVEDVASQEFQRNPPRHISLYVYRDNPGAQELYFKAGFITAREDSVFEPLWTFSPRRLLLVKALEPPPAQAAARGQEQGLEYVDLRTGKTYIDC